MSRLVTIKRLLPASVLALISLLAVLPLIRFGCSCGHDLSFHLLSWMEAAHQFSAGTLHPQWAFTAGWNAGEPRFLFYPPISWVLGGLLGLLESAIWRTPEQVWSAVPILYTWLVITSAGLTMHRLVRHFAGPGVALLTAAMYMLNPYMLFNAYQRTAYAELLASAWIPLLLLAILRPRPRAREIAGALALLWLTNAPAAVMGTYSLALLAGVRLILLQRSSHSAAAPASKLAGFRGTHATGFAESVAGGTVLGLGLASFYIVPAALERRFVQIDLALVPGMRIRDSYLFSRMGEPFHDDVVLVVSKIALFLLIAATGMLLANLVLERRAGPKTSIPAEPPGFHSRDAVMPLLVITAAIAFLLLPVSQLLWDHLPELRFLQFSWRLVSVQSAIFALSAGLLLGRLLHAFAERRWHLPAVIAAVLLAAAISGPFAERHYRQPCEDEDLPSTRAEIFYGLARLPEGTGSMPTDEYTPQTADNDAQDHTDPPYWLSDDANSVAPEDGSAGAAPLHLQIAPDHPRYAILNLRLFPLWHLMLNGHATPMTPLRDDGLIAVPLQAGANTIDLKLAPSFIGTSEELAGSALSLLSVILLITLWLVPLKRTHRATQSNAWKP